MARTLPTWAGWLAGGAAIAAAVVAYVVLVQPDDRDADTGPAAPPAAALSPGTEAPTEASPPVEGTAAPSSAAAPDAAQPGPVQAETTPTQSAETGTAPTEAAAPEPAEIAAASPEPAADPEAAPAEDPGTTRAAPGVTAPLAPPSFDTVRIDRDGGALVAGRADPNARVVVRVDGEIVADAEADGAGNFVTLFSLPPGETMRVMTLEAAPAGAAADTAPVLSEQSVIIQPAARTAPAGGEAVAGLAPQPAAPS
ncbi:MAG: hypothetical protein KDK53_12185, partial [Maritimibacter sp.]|nr:hypothetical protein [Maritimibacter sp.]